MSNTALNDHVLILPDPPKEMTKSGLLLPKDFHETVQSGTVKSVQEYRYEFGQRITAQIASGDRVYYPKNQIIAKIDSDEGELVVVHHSALLVKIVIPPVPADTEIGLSGTVI